MAARPTALEHEIALEAWQEGREVRRGELVVATPLRDYAPGESRPSGRPCGAETCAA